MLPGQNISPTLGGMKTHQRNSHGQSLIGRGRAFAQIMSWVTGEIGGADVVIPDSDVELSRVGTPIGRMNDSDGTLRD